MVVLFSFVKELCITPSYEFFRFQRFSYIKRITTIENLCLSRFEGCYDFMWLHRAPRKLVCTVLSSFLLKIRNSNRTTHSAFPEDLFEYVLKQSKVFSESFTPFSKFLNGSQQHIEDVKNFEKTALHFKSLFLSFSKRTDNSPLIRHFLSEQIVIMAKLHYALKLSRFLEDHPLLLNLLSENRIQDSMKGIFSVREMWSSLSTSLNQFSLSARFVRISSSLI